jgi:hypothetical protein
VKDSGGTNATGSPFSSSSLKAPWNSLIRQSSPRVAHSTPHRPHRKPEAVRYGVTIDLRMTVLKRLAAGADARFSESYLINPIANDYHCQPRHVWEVLWGLLSEGLLYLDRNGQSGSDNWQWRLSTLGQVVASGSTRWEPRDVDGYLRRLRANKNPVDTIALRYMEEALRAFAARCYLASSVMLGTASERVVIELASSVARYIGQPQAKKLSELLTRPWTAQFNLFTEMRKHMETVRKAAPEGMADAVTLDAVADLLRVARNEAGHPTGTMIDEDTAYTHLQLGARYVLKMTDLTAWLDQRPAR